MNTLSCLACGLMLWSMPHPAATDRPGNIFLSKDEGSNWTRADTGLPPDATISAWITIPDGVMASTEDHGIYASQDKLKTWHSAHNGLPPDLKIKTLVVHNGAIFAGSYLHGVYVSHNTGDSWEKSSEGLGEISVRCLYSLNNVLYAGTDGGVYRSADHGLHWKHATRGMQVNALTSWSNTLYAATNMGVLRSGDGRRWLWSWKGGALFNISADDGMISSILPSGEVYVCKTDSDQGMTLRSPFNQYTFRLTPLGSPVLRAPWRKTFRSLREQASFQGYGLPQKPPLSQILKTPFGILVAVGRGSDGC